MKHWLLVNIMLAGLFLSGCKVLSPIPTSTPTSTPTLTPTLTPIPPTITPSKTPAPKGKIPDVEDIRIEVADDSELVKDASFNFSYFIVETPSNTDWQWKLRFYNNSGWAIRLYGYRPTIYCEDGRSYYLQNNAYYKKDVVIPPYEYIEEVWVTEWNKSFASCKQDDYFMFELDDRTIKKEFGTKTWFRILLAVKN